MGLAWLTEHFKNINMRTFNFITRAFLFIFIFSLTSCSSQKMIYESIGIMDKPLPTIEITLIQNEKSDSDRIFIVDKKTFELLKNYMYVQLDKKRAVTENDYEYGAYKISYYSGSKKTEYMLESKEQSIIFFSGQKRILKPEDELYKEIEVLLKRLGSVAN
ncbi:hypothetical protein D3C85_422330 [compost metagenome]